MQAPFDCIVVDGRKLDVVNRRVWLKHVGPKNVAVMWNVGSSEVTLFTVTTT